PPPSTLSPYTTLFRSPPLTAAATAITCCIGVTDTPCPKDDVPNSTFPISSGLNNIPLPSPCKSIPVFSPNPKSFIYVNNFSFPKFNPKLTKPGLQEFSTTSIYVCRPCPPLFQHLKLAPLTDILPLSLK